MHKRVLLKIDEKYANKYGLSKGYISKKIVLYDDRIHHMELHKSDFVDENSYNISLNNLDDIIQNPDFISENTQNSGLEFVKKLVDNVLVAVRISDQNELKVRSMYPINNAKYARLKK